MKIHVTKDVPSDDNSDIKVCNAKKEDYSCAFYKAKYKKYNLVIVNINWSKTDQYFYIFAKGKNNYSYSIFFENSTNIHGITLSKILSINLVSLMINYIIDSSKFIIINNIICVNFIFNSLLKNYFNKDKKIYKFTDAPPHIVDKKIFNAIRLSKLINYFMVELIYL